LLPLILALAAGLGYAVLSLPDQAQGLQGAVADQLKKSGVSNPVTAVLLNFRGYDTLLEMVVLLLALLGVWSLGAQPAVCTESDPGPVLDTLTRLLVPVLVLVATYLLWAGAHAPGGHFRLGRSWWRPECCGFFNPRATSTRPCATPLTHRTGGWRGRIHGG
jgi:multisubunit Na+/H+ antiporter MnhB subunit